MDYPGYYKLALQKTYGGEFPGMSSEEFDRRCPLPKVPEALKALYLTLGSTRICGMHLMIPPPEELHLELNLVIFGGAWAISAEDLHEENPLIYTVEDFREDADSDAILTFRQNDATRVALQLVNLIAESAAETGTARAAADTGRINRFRNRLTFLTRNRLRLLIPLSLVVFIYISWQLLLRGIYPSGVTLLMLAGLGILVCSLFRLYFYWNVWLDWNDNVRFGRYDDPLFVLARDLGTTYLQWNLPELWRGSFRWHPDLSLRQGSDRYCQSRYDFLPESDGEIPFPGLAPIRYEGNKPLSLLFRATLGDDKSLRFTHAEAGRKWKLPKLAHPQAVGKRQLTEDMTIQIGPPDQVPVPLQNLLRRKCAEYPAIRKAWLCPAIMEGVPVYLLAILAPEPIDLGPLLQDVLAMADRPFNAYTTQDASDMEKFPPLFTGGEK